MVTDEQTIGTLGESSFAVILAAGLGLRLGPLAGMGKAQVRYRSAPALVTQLAALAKSGIQSGMVVCRPEHELRVSSLAEEVARPLGMKFQVQTQSENPGPGMAFAHALADVPPGCPVLLMLADTIVSSVPQVEASWIAVAKALSDRRWCCVYEAPDGSVSALRNARATPHDGIRVAVGLYYFANRESLDVAAEVITTKSATVEIELSEILLEYLRWTPLQCVAADEWVDLGDLAAIARATRTGLTPRPPARIVVDELGIACKRSRDVAGMAQARFLRDLAEPSSRLFPHVWNVSEDLTEISMEYISYPTLAELYLYSPGAGEYWGELLSGIVDRVRRLLWQQFNNCGEVTLDEVRKRCRNLYIGKPRSRFMHWWKSDIPSRSSRLIVNGRQLTAGPDALDLLDGLMDPVCESPDPAQVHGDLNFSNILYAVEAQAFRLLDPRGSFGGEGPLGDARYDAAKLRHSYAGMFDAGVHGIFRVERIGPKQFDVSIGPDRSTAQAAMDRVLESFGFAIREISIIEASLFLSMLPLHAENPQRQWLFYLRGLQLLGDLAQNTD